MVEPVLTGALLWLAKEIASEGIRKIMDSAFEGPAPTLRRPGPGLAPVRRYDLSGRARITTDVDVVVRYPAGAGQALPVVLTFQDAGGTKGEPFPTELTDTTHVTLRRGHYLISALVLRMPAKLGGKPTLLAIGWEQPWIAASGVKLVTISTRTPTVALVRELGLVGADGKPLFLMPRRTALPAPPALPSGPVTVRRTAVTRRPRERVRPLDSAADRLPARLATRCLARDEKTRDRCAARPLDHGLCAVHLFAARRGTARWHATGIRVVLPPS